MKPQPELDFRHIRSSRAAGMRLPGHVRRDLLGHLPNSMTGDYTHTSSEGMERAVRSVTPYSGVETNEEYVKTRKASPRGQPSVPSKLLKRKVAGGRLELPTLGL